MFKNHKLIKIFQKEEYEKKRAENYLSQLKRKKSKNPNCFCQNVSYNGNFDRNYDCSFNFYSGILMSRGDLDINNFFSFLAAMMLAYQPVRSLSTLNMVLNQGLSAGSRILPIIDQKNNIADSSHAKTIQVKNSNIKFQNVIFYYEKDEGPTLDKIKSRI